MNPSERKVELLQQSRYFHGLDRGVLDKLAAVSQLVGFGQGDVLIRQGTAADALYVVEDGTVEVYVEDGATGAERLVKRMSRGACFGEIALLTGFSRTATVRADDEGSLLMIGGAELEALMGSEPAVGLAMCKTLAAWIYSANIQDQYRFVSLDKTPFQAELAASVPEEMLEYYQVVPLEKDGQRVIVGMVNPTNLLGVDAARRHFPSSVIEVVAIGQEDYDYLVSAARGARAAAADSGE